MLCLSCDLVGSPLQTTEHSAQENISREYPQSPTGFIVVVLLSILDDSSHTICVLPEAKWLYKKIPLNEYMVFTGDEHDWQVMSSLP